MTKETGFYIFLLAGGMVVTGNHFNIPWLSTISIMLIGIIALIAGIRVIIKGKAVMGKVRISNPDYIERYRGLPARLLGMVIMFAGLIFITLSIAGILYKDGASTFLNDLVDTKYGVPLILGLAGFIGAIWGIVRIMTGTATAPGTHARHIEFGIKLQGAITTILGIIAFALAVAEFIQPGFIKGLIAHFQKVILGYIIFIS